MSAETQGYSRDLLKQDTERVKTKEELAREKTADGKKLIETEEGKKTLAMKWIDKAKLGEAGKKAVLAEIGVDENTPAKEFVEKVAAWQEQNGLAKPGEGDGVLGWKTLEAVDNKISEKFDTEQDANDSQGSSSGGRLADIDTDEKESIKLKAEALKKPGSAEYTKFMQDLVAGTDKSTTSLKGEKKSPDDQLLFGLKKDTSGKVIGIENTRGDVYNLSSGKWEKPEEWSNSEKDRTTSEKIKTKDSPEYKQFINDTINGMTEGNTGTFKDPSDNQEVVVTEENGQLIAKKGKQVWSQDKWEDKEQTAHESQTTLANKLTDRNNDNKTNYLDYNYGSDNNPIRDILLENLTAEKINSDKIGLPDEQKKQVISLIENAGPELGSMTLGEYTDLVKSPTKAANEMAKEKRGKLPGKLGEYGMEYQKKGDITLKFKEGSNSIERIITKTEDGTIKEEALSEYALRTEKTSTDLPDGGRVVRTTGPDGKQVINYYPKKTNSSPDFVFQDGKWETPGKTA